MNPPALDFRNVNALWASVLAETLARSGVRQAVVCPGSRSTALAFAFARHPGLEAIPVLDERSAGFFALGLAKWTHRPVVLVCTSGTAAANFLPALVEAREAGVPLVALTADRPPEMRACASGQTIDQQKLYGEQVVFFHELAVPELDAGRFAYLRQTVAHAVARTLGPFRGPVHLNAPFRDPLPPLPDGGAAEAFAAGIGWERFFEHLQPAGGANGPRGPASGTGTGGGRVGGERLTAETGWAAQSRGLIVAGPAGSEAGTAQAAAVAAIATRLGWPVLADGLAPARHRGGRVPHLVTAYDAILRSTVAAEALRPDVVLCLGEWPTSKVLRSWIGSSNARILLASDRADNRDPLHGFTRCLGVDAAGLAEILPAAGGAEDPARADYRERWLGCEVRARRALNASLSAEDALVEPKAAWLLARHLPEGTPVSVANSMPVRDVEYVWPAGARGVELHFNRGANGIDGTLSTALGVAHGAAPSVLLTGDLALLHDANGFLLRPKFRGSLTVVLINNRGGGIFEHLPVARFDPIFEEFFATPQEADFGALCGAYSVPHTVVRGWDEFTALVSELPQAGIRVLELRTDRKRDAAWRRETFAAVAAEAAKFDRV